MHIVVSLIFGTTLLLHAEQAFDRVTILESELPAVAKKPQSSTATAEIADAARTVVETDSVVETNLVDAEATEVDVEDTRSAEAEMISLVEPASVESDAVETAGKLVNAWPHLREETRVAILMLVRADELMQD